MILEIAVDEFDLRCEVKYANRTNPDYRTWASDHDYWGGCELEYRALSGRRCDENGHFTPLTDDFTQAVATLNDEHIKHELWIQIEARAEVRRAA